MTRELSRCPHCGARGVRIADSHISDGCTLVFDYCGQCGKNWPLDHQGTPREKVGQTSTPPVTKGSR